MTVQETWLTDTLCQVGPSVRIEYGPQRVQMECTAETIADSVTPARYKVGAPDALGKTIALGERMTIIDSDARHKPFLWTVYELRTVEGEARYFPVGGNAVKETALAEARAFAEAG